jgi:lysylphosphatidylglycerol synthetase-like protein (DUF2156 family)
MHGPKVPSGARLITDPRTMSAGDVQRLERLAYLHGRHYDSYLITEPNRQYLWTDHGCVGFLQRDQYVHVLGGLMADVLDRPALADDLTAFARMNGYSVGLHGMAERELAPFRTRGFHISKVGEEGILPLEHCDWTGRRFRWLRHQVNSVARQHIEVQEARQADYTAGDWKKLLSELADVSRLDLARRPQKHEPPGFYGRLLPEHLHRRRLFVARKLDGRVQAFTACTPALAGTMWSPELTRRRPDAVKGITAFLWFHVMNRLKSDGARWFNFGLTPGVGCDTPEADDSWVMRHLLRFCGRHFPGVYNVHGIHAYKSRYRPMFRNVYVCVYPRITLGWCWSFIRLSGFFDLKAESWRHLLPRKFRPDPAHAPTAWPHFHHESLPDSDIPPRLPEAESA